MAKKMITRSITAPTIYTEGIPNGIHVPGTSMRSAEIMAENMGQGKVIKVVMETHIYEMEEDVFLKHAVLKPPKLNNDDNTKTKKEGK